MPFKITKDSRIQWFQIRIIHRIIGTNYYLHKIKYNDNPLCTFCKNENETIEHLFWQCSFVKDIIDIYFKTKKNIFPSLTADEMIFGLTDESPLSKTKNLILIYFKMYIYQCRMQKSIPTVFGAKKYITYCYNIEKETAMINNNVETFNSAWNSYLIFLYAD